MSQAVHSSDGDGTAIAAALRQATADLSAVETSRLDAEVLLAFVLGTSRAAVLGRGRDVLAAPLLGRYMELVGRRKSGTPVAYLTGRSYFYGLELEVTPDVLIPRPETELLVEWSLDRLASRPSGCDVLDVGTGSGAIALALAAHDGAARIDGTDVSPAAIRVARRNADRLGMTSAIQWHVADMVPRPARTLYGLVAANLPYIGEDEIDEVSDSVLCNEPRQALLSGPDGLAAIRRLLALLPCHVGRVADICVEIGWRQAARVLTLAGDAFPGGRIALHHDLAGLPRMVTIEVGRG